MTETILIIGGGLLLCYAAFREGYLIGWDKGWEDAKKWFRLGL